MKSINVVVDDKTLANAEQFAFKLNTSVAGLVNDFLHQLPRTESDQAEARRQFIELSKAARGEVGPRTWTRSDLYDR